ncbi:MAG: hypothetical protein RMI91_01625 [Gemmatales bacterium]|nr:hypothetical protein [Gemmatales bacterium]MDW7993326.1 hypothetical protein [Gemmatales bacterium]
MGMDFEEEAELEGAEEFESLLEPKRKKPKKTKKARRERSAMPKITRKGKAARMRIVWGVFSSSVQCVQTFPYPQKQEAEALAAKLTAEKKSLFFVQPVREPIVEESSSQAQT